MAQKNNQCRLSSAEARPGEECFSRRNMRQHVTNNDGDNDKHV